MTLAFITRAQIKSQFLRGGSLSYLILYSTHLRCLSHSPTQRSLRNYVICFVLVLKMFMLGAKKRETKLRYVVDKNGHVDILVLQ